MSNPTYMGDCTDERMLPLIEKIVRKQERDAIEQRDPEKNGHIIHSTPGLEKVNVEEMYDYGDEVFDVQIDRVKYRVIFFGGIHYVWRL